MTPSSPTCGLPAIAVDDSTTDPVQFVLDRRSGDGLESPDAIGAVPRRHRSRRRLRAPASRRPGVPDEMATGAPSLTYEVYTG